MTTTTPAGTPTALERLADELDSAEFTTALVTGTERRPVLTVASRRTRAAEDIYADGWFWWSWGPGSGARSWSSL